MVDEIIARIDALTALLKDLLLFAQRPSRAHAVDFGLAAPSNGSVPRRDPALSRHPIASRDTARPMTADPELLTIVFQNLLLNAAQAMHGRGTVTVRLTATDGVRADFDRQRSRPLG